MLGGALLLLLASAAVDDGAAAPASDDAGEREGAPLVDAWLYADEAYRLRAAGAPFGGVDNDVRLLLDTGARGFDGRVGIEMSGALFWDLDHGGAGEGTGAGGERNAPPGFGSVHDARGPIDLLVDTLAVRTDLAGTALLQRAQLGRFTVEEGWPVTLDGAAFTLVPLTNARLAWSVFASMGRTVHFFTTPALADDSALAEAWAASVGSDVVLRDGLKLQADYRALGDPLARDPRRPTHSYGAAAWRRVDDVLLVHAFGRGLDDELSHVGARAHAAWVPWGVGLDAEVVHQVATLGEVLEGQDVFFAVLGVSHPHVRGRIDAFASRPFAMIDDALDGEGTLHLGAHVRQRLAGEDAPFNRNAARLYASVDADDVVIDGLFASLIGSYDFATASDDIAVAALGGAVGYGGDAARIRAGTSWDRVKYTYYRDVAELVDVRTVFVAAEWRPWRALRVKGDYTLELADRTIHTLQVGLSHDLDGTLRGDP